MTEELAGSNPTVRRIRRLARDRGFRWAQASYVVEGPTLVTEAIGSGLDIKQVLVSVSAASHGVVAMSERAGVPCSLVADHIFEALTTTRNPQPALAEVGFHDVPLSDLVATQGTTLILAGVSDPGNAGTLVRSAEAFGAAGVVFANGVDPYNPKVVRAAAGSTLRLPIAVPPGRDPIWEVVGTFGAAGYKVVAAVINGGITPEEVDQGQPLVLVVGSEPHGLNDSLIEACDVRVSLSTGGGGDSLNVAVAGSVLLYTLRSPHGCEADENDAPAA